MAKAGIVFENEKLVVFDKHLTKAGYSYVQHGEFTPGSMLIVVETDDLRALGVVVEAAYKEATQP